MLNQNAIIKLLNEIKNDGCEYEYLANYIVENIGTSQEEKVKDCEVLTNALEVFAQIINQEARG